MTRQSMRRSLIVGLIAGVLGVLPAAQADDGSPATSGPRVRVTAPVVSGKRLVGTVVHMDEGTLTLWPADGRAAIELPRNAITRLDVSRNRSRKGAGAGIGMLVGLGVAVAVGLATGGGCQSFEIPDPFLPGPPGRQSNCAGKGDAAVLTSLVTAPLGALIGYAVAPGERWIATTPDRLQVVVKPGRGGGVGASLSVRF